MLWICVCIIAGIIGLFLLGIAPSLKSDFLDLIGMILTVAAVVGAVLILVFFIASRASIDTVIEEKYKEYTVYSTLYELDAFADDPIKEMLLYQEILDYNEGIITAQKKMNSNWTNIFYPKEHWGDVPVIEIKRIE